LQRLQRKPRQRFVVPVDIDAKMRLLQHYASQIVPLFGDEEGMRRCIGSQMFQEQPCEYYWQAQPIHPPIHKEKIHAP
jgi:hypothetical protein